jgi:pyrroline-5-carboxylate reductase
MEKGEEKMWTDKLAFVGAGNIAEVIMDRLITIGSLSPSHMFACDILADRRAYLRQRFTGLHTSEDPREAVQFAKCIIIGTPASAVPSVIHEIRPALTSAHVLICLATSAPLAELEKLAGENAVVRALVNTPSLVGEGMNLVAFGSRVSPEYRSRINALLNLLGPRFEVSDAQMDFWCGICAAGPTYVLPVIQALANAAMARGIAHEQAMIGASQVVLGAARLVQQTGKDPAELERLSTSLRTLREDEVFKLFSEAYEETLRRLREATVSAVS